MAKPVHAAPGRAAIPAHAPTCSAAPAASSSRSGAKSGILVAGLMICLIVAGNLDSPAQAQETVPGPWGDLVDPVKPLQLDTDDAKVLHVRRQHMRAMSAHFRSMEAIVRYGAPEVVDLAASADALAGLSAALPALFGPEWGATSGSRGAWPEIWTRRDLFERHIAGFDADTRKLAADARAGGNLTPALTAVRHQCLACHQAFRGR